MKGELYRHGKNFLYSFYLFTILNVFFFLIIIIVIIISYKLRVEEKKAQIEKKFFSFVLELEQLSRDFLGIKRFLFLICELRKKKPNYFPFF